MTPLETLLKYPFVPVYYNSDTEKCIELLQASYNGGVRGFEFTNRGENALEVFKELKKYSNKNLPHLFLGIGTISTAKQAQDFIKAGADFVVQPFTTPSVGEICSEHNTLWIPGTFTPTEIHVATNLGAQMVKIFPGNVLQPQYIKALRGPMPHTKIMVTGGVEPTVTSTQEWLSAGVNAVGLGSQLFAERDATQITKTLQKLFNPKVSSQ